MTVQNISPARQYDNSRAMGSAVDAVSQKLNQIHMRGTEEARLEDGIKSVKVAGSEVHVVYSEMHGFEPSTLRDLVRDMLKSEGIVGARIELYSDEKIAVADANKALAKLQGGSSTNEVRPEDSILNISLVGKSKFAVSLKPGQYGDTKPFEKAASRLLIDAGLMFFEVEVVKPAVSLPTAPAHAEDVVQANPARPFEAFSGKNVAPTAPATAIKTKAPFSFAPLGPPALVSDVAVPLLLRGLKPNQSYAVTLARPDRWDPTQALTRTVTLKASAAGELLLGEADVRALPGVGGRKLTDDEKAAAGVVFAKLLDRVPVDTLAEAHPELATSLKGDGDAQTLRVVATEVGGTHKKGYAQPLVDRPDGVVAIPSDFATDGYVGETLLPPGDPSTWGQPAVIWGGSGGFLNSDRANELVAAGRPVLALKYFSYDKTEPAVVAGVLPSPLTRVPLEYFQNAIERFLARPDVGADRGVTILGESRGAEAALLVAQHLGDRLPITDVVAMRPLHFAVGSRINGPEDTGGKEVSSWTVGGKDIPFAALPEDKKQFSWAVELSDGATADHEGKPLPVVGLTPVFRSIEATAPAAAFIDVSQSGARVHLIGGTDDQMWHSGDAVRALTGQRPGQHILVEGGGHYNEPGRRSTAVSEEVRFPITPKAGGPASDTGALVLDGGSPLLNAVSDVAYGHFMQRILAGGDRHDPLPFPSVVRDLQG